MRQNIKRILAVLVLAVSVLGLSACGSTASSDTEFPVTEEYLQSVADGLVDDWNTAGRDGHDFGSRYRRSGRYH